MHHLHAELIIITDSSTSTGLISKAQMGIALMRVVPSYARETIIQTLIKKKLSLEVKKSNYKLYAVVHGC